MLFLAAAVVEFKRCTGLFERTVGVGRRIAMFTDQLRCVFLMECGVAGYGIMIAMSESFFRKRIALEEVPYLGNSPDPPSLHYS
jgi:hypothetical protein